MRVSLELKSRPCTVIPVHICLFERTCIYINMHVHALTNSTHRDKVEKKNAYASYAFDRICVRQRLYTYAMYTLS